MTDIDIDRFWFTEEYFTGHKNARYDLYRMITNAVLFYLYYMLLKLHPKIVNIFKNIITIRNQNI